MSMKMMTARRGSALPEPRLYPALQVRDLEQRIHQPILGHDLEDLGEQLRDGHRRQNDWKEDQRSDQPGRFSQIEHVHEGEQEAHAHLAYGHEDRVFHCDGQSVPERGIVEESAEVLEADELKSRQDIALEQGIAE